MTRCLLGNQLWFSTMDFASGYWQVAMSPEAKRKAAFVTNEGLFQFRVMPFGPIQCPGHVRTAYGPSVVWDEMVPLQLEEVLAHKSDFGLQLKAKKCTLMQTEVGFLRHSVACDPAKLSAVRTWLAPDKVKAVHQFLDFVGYYRQFIKDFAELAEPLVALTQKGASFVWTDRGQTAFDALKACLISAPILGFSTEDGRFLLDTDTSLFADSGRSRGGDSVRQPQSSPISAAILYDTPRNAGGGGDMYTFSVVSAGGSVHPSDISQFSAMATEVSQ